MKVIYYASWYCVYIYTWVTGRIAIPLALEFLKRWPTPQEACQAKLYDILDVIEPLGFGRTRAAIIIRFSRKLPL